MFERIPGSTLKLPIGKSRMRFVEKSVKQDGILGISHNLKRSRVDQEEELCCPRREDIYSEEPGQTIGKK